MNIFESCLYGTFPCSLGLKRVEAEEPVFFVIVLIMQFVIEQAYQTYSA